RLEGGSLRQERGACTASQVPHAEVLIIWHGEPASVRRERTWPDSFPDVAAQLQTDGPLERVELEPGIRKQQGALLSVRPPVLGVASARKCEDALLGPQVPAEHLVFPPAAHQVISVGSELDRGRLDFVPAQ